LVKDPLTVVVRGSSYENLANLAPTFITRILERYEGTHLGRQELHGEILEDREGALWRRQSMIEAYRRTKCPELVRVGIGVDPPGGKTECGIVAGGLGVDGDGYVLDDASLAGSPDTWGKEVVTTYHRNHADRIFAEANFGGDMVESTIRTVDKNVPIKMVHASRGKVIRAEPVAALYEQGRVHHVGQFPLLEDELCTWVPGEGLPSPNRLDALVWVITELMIKPRGVYLA
jgi:phage terminase large subunit-like protein